MSSESFSYNNKSNNKNLSYNPSETKKDCLLCKLTGSLGLLGISAYIFFNASKHQKRPNKIFLNLLGSGI